MTSRSYIATVAILLNMYWVLAQTQLTPQEADKILSMHNAARSAVSPPASNMQQMTWDAQLASSAQTYASTCPSGHSGTKGLGENLSWGWPVMTATKAISMWTDEKPFYTYASKNCQSGKECGHYTQMIWANSVKVGCGKKTCASLMGHGQGDAWVCHYSPAGNYVGQLPYKSGATCSQCPSGSSCVQNQCSASVAPVSSSPATPSSLAAPIPLSAPVIAASGAVGTSIPVGVPNIAVPGPSHLSAEPSPEILHSGERVRIPVIQTSQGPMVPVTITIAQPVAMPMAAAHPDHSDQPGLNGLRHHHRPTRPAGMAMAALPPNIH